LRGLAPRDRVPDLRATFVRPPSIAKGGSGQHMRASILTGSTAMGALCAAVGALTAVLVLASATGAGYEWLLVAAPAAAFVCGATLWWLIMERRGRSGTARGVLTGAIAGAVAHYLCWLLLIWASSACHAITGGCTDSLGQAPMSPLHAIPAAAVYSGFSLVFYGWLTIPAGGLIGGLLATVRRSKRAVPGLILVLLAAVACQPASDSPAPGRGAELSRHSVDSPAGTGGADAGGPARAGRILADGTIIADTFEVRHHLRGETLTVVLETDLPDQTLLNVQLSRTYRRNGASEDFPLDYFWEEATVGAWRRPHTIRIDDAAWRADLENVAAAGAFEVSGIGQDVELSLTVPINQAAPFREGNQNLRGSAVRPSIWGWIVQRELRIPYPVDDAALPSRRGG
jgi:hypothetical protein